MLEAARASVRFYCPECGAGLRALRADAGSVLDCEQCGEHVRIPRHPHPLESEAEDAPLLSASAAAMARTGLRLLLISLAVLVAEYLLLLVVGTYWVARQGPVAVAARDPGDLYWVLAVALGLDLTLVAARSSLRWAGYRLCEPAATAVRARSWVAAARIAVVLRGVGYALACLPLLLGIPAGQPQGLLTAFAEAGLLVWLIGVALEFAVLVAWHRLLHEVRGRLATRQVIRFAYAIGISTVVLSAGYLLLRVYLATSLIREGGPPASPDGQLNLGALPADVWPPVGGFLVFAALLGLALSLLYARIILSLRASLSGTIFR